MHRRRLQLHPRRDKLQRAVLPLRAGVHTARLRPAARRDGHKRRRLAGGVGRESGLPGEGTAWNIEHSSSFMTVDITPADMPSNWHEARQVVFRVKVSILDGAAPQPKTFETTFSLKNKRHEDSNGIHHQHAPIGVALHGHHRGGLEQTKNADGLFDPRQDAVPLALRPRLAVRGTDHVLADGDHTTGLIDTRWYIGTDDKGTRITESTSGFSLGPTGSLRCGAMSSRRRPCPCTSPAAT